MNRLGDSLLQEEMQRNEFEKEKQRKGVQGSIDDHYFTCNYFGIFFSSYQNNIIFEIK